MFFPPALGFEPVFERVTNPRLYQLNHRAPTILQGITGVIVYIDDILVTGSKEEHNQRLEEVLSRLRRQACV